jgi:hypothetical protein
MLSNHNLDNALLLVVSKYLAKVIVDLSSVLDPTGLALQTTISTTAERTTIFYSNFSVNPAFKPS